jgi:hypothetical protein
MPILGHLLFDFFKRSLPIGLDLPGMNSYRNGNTSLYFGHSCLEDGIRLPFAMCMDIPTMHFRRSKKSL